MRRLLLILLLVGSIAAYAQDTPNARQAKRIFTTAWNHIYGSKGVRFHYKINILGLYKEKEVTGVINDKLNSEKQ